VQFKQSLNPGEKAFWKQRFHTEVHIQVSILSLRFGQAAYDQHREVGGEDPQLSDELRAAKARHDVIGDDQIDVARKVLAAKLIESPFWVENSNHDVAGTPQDGLTGCSLDGIVVDEEQGVRHGCFRIFLGSSAQRRSKLPLSIQKADFTKRDQKDADAEDVTPGICG
jgi:hypothetical protein